MATDKPRFSITLDPKLFSEVLDYKEKNRLSTQSKAVQRLIELGIQETKENPSLVFMSLEPDEKLFLEDYRDLNKEGQDYIRQTMAMVKRSYVRKLNDVSKLEEA